MIQILVIFIFSKSYIITSSKSIFFLNTIKKILSIASAFIFFDLKTLIQKANKLNNICCCYYKHINIVLLAEKLFSGVLINLTLNIVTMI